MQHRASCRAVRPWRRSFVEDTGLTLFLPSPPPIGGNSRKSYWFIKISRKEKMIDLETYRWNRPWRHRCPSELITSPRFDLFICGFSPGLQFSRSENSVESDANKMHSSCHDKHYFPALLILKNKEELNEPSAVTTPRKTMKNWRWGGC